MKTELKIVGTVLLLVLIVGSVATSAFLGGRLLWQQAQPAPTWTVEPTETAVQTRAPTATQTIPPPTATGTATRTPTATQTIPPPTATQTRTPTPTATLTATRTPTATKVPTPVVPEAVVTIAWLNLRSGPGTSYPLVTQVQQGTTLQVLGRNAAATWLKVSAPDGVEGWVMLTYVDLNVPVEDIAIVASPPLPVVKPIPLGPSSDCVRNPIPFRWSGALNPGEAYAVSVTYTRDRSVPPIDSGPLMGQEWTIDLDARLFGEWRWTVSVVREEQVLSRSEEWVFWFKPTGSCQETSTPTPIP